MAELCLGLKSNPNDCALCGVLELQEGRWVCCISPVGVGSPFFSRPLKGPMFYVCGVIFSLVCKQTSSEIRHGNRKKQNSSSCDGSAQCTCGDSGGAQLSTFATDGKARADITCSDRVKDSSLKEYFPKNHMQVDVCGQSPGHSVSFCSPKNSRHLSAQQLSNDPILGCHNWGVPWHYPISLP